MPNLQEIFQEARQYAGGLPASYSRMHMLLDCPLAFVLRYQKRVRLPGLPPNDALVTGKQAHWIMEQAVRTAYCCRNFTLAGAEFDFYHGLVLSRAGDAQREAFTALREPMEQVLNRLFRIMALEGTVVTTEKSQKLDLNGQPVRKTTAIYPAGKRPPLGYLGYIDLEMHRKGRMNLVDYKTELPTEERRREVIGQTGMYAYMEFMQDPVLNDISTYCIYLKDATIDKVATYNRERDLATLEQSVLDTFTNYLAALRTVEPTARENRYCEYCDFRAAGLCTLKRRPTEHENAEEGKDANSVGPGA